MADEDMRRVVDGGPRRVAAGGQGGIPPPIMGELVNQTTYYPRGSVVGWSLNPETQYQVELEDPVTTAQSAAADGLDVSRWRNKAGTIIWPSGAWPAKAWVLLRRSDLERQNRNELHELRIRYNSHVISLANMVMSAPPVCVTPGRRGDLKATYLVEFADLRHVLCNRYYGMTVDVQYNVVAADTGTPGDFYRDTKNGSSPWTWQTMLDDLWSRLNVPSQLGSSPPLPFTPDGAPRNFRFPGVPGWLAYNMVLRRLGCTFVLWPDGQVKIVQQGADDGTFDSALANFDNEDHRLEDDEALEIVRGKVPRYVTVYFPKVYTHYGAETTTEWRSGYQPSTSALHAITYDAPAAIRSLCQPGSSVGIRDDMVAFVNYDRAVTNAGDLLIRGQERADDYYRVVYSGGNRMHKIFNGFLNHEGLLPGSQVSAVCWSDTGWGARTEIFNSAMPMRVDDAQGGLIELTEWDINESLKGPDFARQTFPNYPHTQQLARITSATPVGPGIYDAYLERVNPDTLQIDDVHQIWVLDANA